MAVMICDWACENRSITVVHVGSQNLTNFQTFTPIWYGHTIFRGGAYFNWLSNTSYRTQIHFSIEICLIKSHGIFLPTCPGFTGLVTYYVNKPKTV